ncbi:MAG TPA: hypothetical protein VGF69_02350 [Thermoanaerobaculia bacterium]|jgi:hypothetical protein
MRRAPYLLLLCFALPLAAQEPALFPRFSITGGGYFGNFETNVRVDESESLEGTSVNLERDLGLEQSRNMQRFTVQWRPFNRHELAASYFNASRTGFEEIDREITFRDTTYPVRAVVSSEFDLDYRDATYTLWVRKAERDGLGLMLGVAALAVDASLEATAEGESVALSERAETDVPVAVIGAQGRWALTNRIFLEAQAGVLPEVTLDEITGSALTGNARLEWRFLRNVGIGAAYNYFHIEGTVAGEDFDGELDMTIDGAEVYLRLAF